MLLTSRKLQPTLWQFSKRLLRVCIESVDFSQVRRYKENTTPLKSECKKSQYPNSCTTL